MCSRPTTTKRQQIHTALSYRDSNGLPGLPPPVKPNAAVNGPADAEQFQ